jgi:hypothetical protein
MPAMSCIQADLNVHGDVILELLRGYAKDPMGGGEDLPAHSQANLIAEMKKRPDMCVTFLCYVDEVPVGLANCIIGWVFCVYVCVCVCICVYVCICVCDPN